MLTLSKDSKGEEACEHITDHRERPSEKKNSLGLNVDNFDLFISEKTPVKSDQFFSGEQYFS